MMRGIAKAPNIHTSIQCSSSPLCFRSIRTVSSREHSGDMPHCHFGDRKGKWAVAEAEAEVEMEW